jgi:hypothetical protein
MCCGVTIKELDGDVAKMVIGAARTRLLVYTLVSGVEDPVHDTHVTTAYINLDDLKQDSIFMTFAHEHLPSGVGHISAIYKRDPEEYDISFRWYTRVNDNPVDFGVGLEEEEPEPTDIDAMIEELTRAGGYLVPPRGYVENAITATFVSAW